MFIQFISRLLTISFSTFASNPIFIGVGDKVPLQGSGPFHFSSQKSVKVFLNSKPAFFTSLRLGQFTYYERTEKHRVFVLSAPQLKFQKAVEPIINMLVGAKWSMKQKHLVLALPSPEPSVESFLIKKCLSIGKGFVHLDFNKSESVPLVCRESLTPKSTRRLKIVIINSNKSKNTNSGLGVPSTIQWRLEAGKNLKLSEQSGSLGFNKGKLKSSGATNLETTISVGNPLQFETGSEVGLQPQGVFNRRPIEWKKATSLIDVNLMETSQAVAKVKISLNKRSRTAQNSIFELENISKISFLKTGEWQKVLSFQENGKSKTRNGIFGLGLSGTKNSSRSRTEKELWMQVTHAD